MSHFEAEVLGSIGVAVIVLAVLFGFLFWLWGWPRDDGGEDVGFDILEPVHRVRAWWQDRRDEDNGVRLIEGLAELHAIPHTAATYQAPIAITYVGTDAQTIERAERAAWMAEEISRLLTKREAEMYGPGRHAAIGLRDPRRAAIKAPTQAFAALVQAETGEPLLAVGPREVDLAPVRTWQPPSATQLALDIEVTR